MPAHLCMHVSAGVRACLLAPLHACLRMPVRQFGESVHLRAYVCRPFGVPVRPSAHLCLRACAGACVCA
eukprot:7401826-Alexandrium_andersonii.AAC.1